jgi:O-antigen ligase
MTFGFAAVWSIHRWHHALKRLETACFLSVAIFLVWATLLTMSRGALMALIAGHVALVFSRGWRFSLRPVILLLTCLGCFQLLAPQITKIGVQDLSERLGQPKLTEAMTSDGVVASNPAKRFITRGDTHRFSIYAAGFSSMTTSGDWLMGKGLWSSNDRWSCSLPWNPEHLHSVFVDAWVRGGVLALVGLLGVLVWGLYRAWWLAQRGEEIWMMLASFGISGLVFDGDSAFSLLSIPRFETLILWVPLVLASVRYMVLNHEQKAPACAEISSH